MQIPKDPIILLSYINTQLRDTYSSLEEFTDTNNISKKELIEKLNSIDYHYDAKNNRFTAIH